MPSSALSSWPWLAEIGLSAAGFGVCLLFFREAQRGGTLPGCGPRSGCEVVSKSRWARVGPFPVATLGLLVYGVLTVTGLTCLSESLRPFTGFFQSVLAMGAGGAAVWFTVLQLVVIRRVCKFCMVLHSVGAILCGLILLEGRYTDGSLLSGCGSVALLVGIQLLFPSKTHVVMLMPAEIRSGNVAREAPTMLPSPDANHPRAIELLGGRVKVNPGDWPLLGSATAQSVIALMFDITCIECRALYRLLEEAVTQQPTKWAVLTIPVPLDPACNPRVSKAGKESADACDHARLFLSLWRADTATFDSFRRWLMESAEAPSLQAARSKAYKLLGPGQSSLAMTDAQIDAKLHLVIDIYQASPTEQLPQLLLADRDVVGQIRSMAELCAELDKGSSQTLVNSNVAIKRDR